MRFYRVTGCTPPPSACSPPVLAAKGAPLDVIEAEELPPESPVSPPRGANYHKFTGVSDRMSLAPDNVGGRIDGMENAKKDAGLRRMEEKLRNVENTLKADAGQ